ncbi:MAG: DUF1294 domain-containing protein [Acholeplasmatales bacterium]|nr:DUF1294 domain-containing protein [Acholeplasmatales bacterium]
MVLLLIYIGYILLLSVLTFFCYGKDKSLAKKSNGKRMKEKTLLGLTAFGGAIGAFFGRIIFRHKTDKIYFSFTIYMSLLFEIAVLGVFAYFYFK